MILRFLLFYFYELIMWIKRIISSLFSNIFKRANIFSLIDFLTNLFTSQCYLWCGLSNQGDYSEFNFNQKSLKNPLSLNEKMLFVAIVRWPL